MPIETNIATDFFSWASSAPENVAILSEHGEFTYGELLALAQGLRAFLPKAPRIGILSHRCPHAYASVLAATMNGSAYVPIRPSSRPERNRSLLRMAGATTLVVGEECLAALEELLEVPGEPLEIVTLGESTRMEEAVLAHEGWTFRRARPSAILPGPPPSAPLEGTAAIFFTSGTTGTPKAVQVMHRNAAAFIESFTAAYPMGPDDRLTQFADLAFDASMHDLFVAWKCGASLVSIPERALLNPLDFVREHGTTIWFSGPSVVVCLEAFGLAHDNFLPKVRHSFFGGDAFSWHSLQTWKRVAPNSRCTNIYGTTETTMGIIAFDVPEDFPEDRCHNGAIPVGAPLAGQSIEILREDGTPCLSGEQGMMWISGSQVTPGYLDRSLNEGRFVDRSGVVWYRTGDIVLRDSHDAIHFVGRKDLQVKILGFMLDLGDVEAAIARIAEAPFAVVDVATRDGVEELACVLPRGWANRKAAIKASLSRTLEPHQIPRRWFFQDELPLNPSGKVDRQALRSQWSEAADRSA